MEDSGGEMLRVVYNVFFFSSRRRHTRFDCDWSSDVCSSDLPLAGAIGAGLPVSEAVGSLLVDVGGGTSEMAVTALGAMVVSHSIRVGGYELDEAIVRYLQDHEGLLIGQEQAEVLKLAVGSALEPDDASLVGE